MKIEMVDLKNQYLGIKSEIDEAIQDVIHSSQFIKGDQVHAFEKSLATYLGVKHVISCGNGTDAIQIALMALELEAGSEIIIPAFTYAAVAEMIILLGLTPKLVDVHVDSFNMDPSQIENAIGPNTRAIIPVHLFGQCSNMEEILAIAKKNGLYVIEDNAQSIGSLYQHSNGEKTQAGTIGDIGTSSFFPSKNLACFGDGGALFTNNDELASRIRMIANHGQRKKYHHEIIGLNSRLDTIQAAILSVKLKYLDSYITKRQKAAQIYDKLLSEIKEIKTPSRSNHCSHVFHQYTIQVAPEIRDELKTRLADKGIPSMVYYPICIHEQEAFRAFIDRRKQFLVSQQLTRTVLSLPIHTELEYTTQEYISQHIKTIIEQIKIS